MNVCGVTNKECCECSPCCNSRKTTEETTEEKQLYIINHYGMDKQLDQLIEECSELIQAICKWKRYGWTDTSIDYLDQLIEEIADVLNIIDQLQLNDSFIGAGIENVKACKVNRQLDRISQELQDAEKEEESKALDCKFDL